MAASDIRVKGQSFKGFIKALDELYGAGFAGRVAQRLPDDFRDALQYGGIVSGGWYSLGWYRDLHVAAQRVGNLPASFARDIGRVSTTDDLKGIYSFIVRMLSPQTLLGQVQRIYRMYFDGGDVKVVRTGPTATNVVYSQCVGVTDSIFEELLGGSAAILELCGGKDIDARIVAREPHGVTMSFTWRE